VLLINNIKKKKKIMNIKNTLHGLNISIQKILVLGMILAFAGGAVAYAQFYRTSGGSDYDYGYGYGYDNGTGYGYGYTNREDPSGSYGFFGDDGSAVINVISKTQTSIDFDYITTYTATNTVEYGMDGNFDMAFDSKLQSAGIFSNTLTDLTCDTEYNIRVSSEDAGGNIWTNSTTTATSSCDSDKDDDKDGGKGGSSGGSAGPTVQPVLSSDVPVLQTQLRGLLMQMVEILKAQMQSLSGETTSDTEDRTLRLEMRGDDVKLLQQRLNKLGFTIALDGVGSLGNETSFFGPLTKAALEKFQSAMGLTVDGIFGPITRAALLKALL
jgi:hypothetical protein